MWGKKLNFKHLSVILLLIFVLFTISAVSAADETVADNATNESSALTPVVEDNTTSTSDVTGYTRNISYSNASSASNVENPLLQIALIADGDNPLNQHVDVSVGDKDNSVSLSNKNYFFAYAQDNTPVKSNTNSLIDVILFNRNNSYILNVSLLNKAHQEVELAAPNFLWDFINKLISAFFSLFN